MVRMRLKSLLYSSKRTRRVASLLLLALATSPLLLVASGPSTKAGEAKGSTKKETSPLATQAVKHFDRQEQIIDLAREENKKQTRMSNRIFDLSLEVGGTNAELEHVGGLLNKLDRLTRRDIPEPRTPEERVVSYLKREGILIFEIASLDSEIRGLKRFQEGLARLREGVYHLRETASEIAKRFDRLRLLKQRVDLSKLNYEAARNNN